MASFAQNWRDPRHIGAASQQIAQGRAHFLVQRGERFVHFECAQRRAAGELET